MSEDAGKIHRPVSMKWIGLYKSGSLPVEERLDPPHPVESIPEELERAPDSQGKPQFESLQLARRRCRTELPDVRKQIRAEALTFTIEPCCNFAWSPSNQGKKPG
jgi:hypothetical protein